MIQRLEWDSAFFGYDVAGLKLEHPDELKNLPDPGWQYNLLYLFVDATKDDPAAIRALWPSAVLADKKVVYYKKLSPVPECDDPEIVRFAAQPVSQAFYKLAWSSGVYSRFRLDSRIGEEKFRQMYSEWLDKSVGRQIAEEVFIAGPADAPYGFITIGKKKGRYDIGLIAVDAAVRNAQIGSRLIRRAEAYAWSNGIDELQVVTQQDNTGACRFYEKNGFETESITHIYHIWNNT